MAQEPERMRRSVSRSVALFGGWIEGEAEGTKREGEGERGAELGTLEPWIGAKQAAMMLEVTTGRLWEMVRAGLLLCRQKVPGQSGSPRLFETATVERLRDSGKHQTRRERWRFRKTRQIIVTTGSEPWEMLVWLTSRQAVEWLGVSASRLCNLRKSGRIRSIRERRTGKAGSPPRLYRREDIAALLADPTFQKNRAKFQKGETTQLRKALAITTALNERLWRESPTVRWLDVRW